MHALAAVRRDIRSRDSAGVRKYLREFNQAFRDYREPLSAGQLDQKIDAASIVLIGDYHALPASQRFAASVLERVAQDSHVVLATEAVLSRDQKIIDSWWRREIGEGELRERLRFDRDWGYQWPPFYELLTCAREHAEGVYGLDCMPRHDLRRIRLRDRHAAEKIREIRGQHPRAKIVVLIGESHLAPQHLPSILQRTLPEERTLTVLQNIDSLYWRAVGERRTSVGITNDVVCVFNSSPLEKYESYRLCIERWQGDDQPDFAPAVHNLILSLARTLEFLVNSSRNGTQPKHLVNSLPEVITAGTTSEFDLKNGSGYRAVSSDEDIECLSSEKTFTALEECSCIYLPATNSFLVRELQMPFAAREASRFLYHACQGMTGARRSWGTEIEDILAYFGSRLLCPGNQEANSSADARGEALYQSYLNGRITRAMVRRIFMSRAENPAEARKVLASISQLSDRL